MKVAVIGGGPGGSTVGSIIKRYRPSIEVEIFEREKFPRDHIGESLLPIVSEVLFEIGAWDKIEMAEFPVKIGATYRWGKTDDLWDFEFLPGEDFQDEARPSKFAGQRSKTAFQVDRSIYDKILLDHAAELGCKVREETKVAEVLKEGDRVTGLRLESGEIVTADYYLDCSGHVGLLRRAMGVEVHQKTTLQNVAFWDYWQNAEWAVRIGVGGTRIQIMSVGYGWMWFIPLGPTRTSLGLVMPADYYKKTGRRPEDLYMEAVTNDSRIGPLIANAEREHKFTTTKDWSFLSSRLYGENWYLCGECAGFADPILSAGLTLTHTGARQLAYVLMAVDKNPEDKAWLDEYYDETQKKRISQHIQFADFWYSANAHFTELVDFTAKIASDAGFELDANKAWQRLGTGGFSNDTLEAPSFVDSSIGSLKQIAQRFTGTKADWEIGKNNVFKLDIEGAEPDMAPLMHEGKIVRVKCWRRQGHILPQVGMFQIVCDVLRTEPRIQEIGRAFQRRFATSPEPGAMLGMAAKTMESMVAEGWIKASFNPKYPLVPFETPEETEGIRTNRDAERFGANASR